MQINFHGDVLATRTHCNFIISFTYELILVKNTTTSFEVFTVAKHLRILVVFWNVTWFPTFQKKLMISPITVSKYGPTIHPGHLCTSLLACHFFHTATNGHIFILCYSTSFGTLHGR